VADATGTDPSSNVAFIQNKGSFIDVGLSARTTVVELRKAGTDVAVNLRNFDGLYFHWNDTNPEPHTELLMARHADRS